MLLHLTLHGNRLKHLAGSPIVADSAKARFENGWTRQDAPQAKQEWAQADYDLEAAKGTLNDAQVALVDALGIFPATQLHVATIPKSRWKMICMRLWMV